MDERQRGMYLYTHIIPMKEHIHMYTTYTTRNMHNTRDNQFKGATAIKHPVMRVRRLIDCGTERKPLMPFMRYKQ